MTPLLTESTWVVPAVVSETMAVLGRAESGRPDSVSVVEVVSTFDGITNPRV
jgi:hypothetical protein